jgi:hypothetical protein
MSDLDDFYAEIAEAECLVENQVEEVSEAGSNIEDTKIQSSSVISKQASESIISAPAVLSTNPSYRPPLLSSAPKVVVAASAHVETHPIPVISAPAPSFSSAKRSAADAGVAAASKHAQPHKRACAGEVWVDPTLDEWPENDFRMFVGNLGNEVTDDMLSEPFAHMKSFVKARVVREPKTKKSKGYGFLSFTEPADALAALNSFNGRYIGNRPITIKRASNDKEFDKSKFKKKQ